MGTGKQYDEESAADEPGIPKGTLGTWLHKARAGETDTGTGTRSPDESLILKTV